MSYFLASAQDPMNYVVRDTDGAEGAQRWKKHRLRNRGLRNRSFCGFRRRVQSCIIQGINRQLRNARQRPEYLFIYHSSLHIEPQLYHSNVEMRDGGVAS